MGERSYRIGDHDWTASQLARLIRMIRSIDCGYCLDGEDDGALPCPECNRTEPKENDDGRG